MAKLVDAQDLGSCVHWTCGFESRFSHHPCCTACGGARGDSPVPLSSPSRRVLHPSGGPRAHFISPRSSVVEQRRQKSRAVGSNPIVGFQAPSNNTPYSVRCWEPSNILPACIRNPVSFCALTSGFDHSTLRCVMPYRRYGQSQN